MKKTCTGLLLLVVSAALTGPCLGGSAAAVSAPGRPLEPGANVLTLYGNVLQQGGVSPWTAGNVLRVRNLRTGGEAETIIGLVEFGTYGLVLWALGGETAAQEGDTLEFDLPELEFAVTPGHYELTAEVIAAARARLDLVIGGTPDPSDAEEDPARTGGGLVLAPNPVPGGGGGWIRFVLPDADGGRPSRLEVFSSTGRKVRSLFSGALPGGYHQISWDRRDEAGRMVGGGVYHVCLQIAGKQIRQDWIVLR